MSSKAHMLSAARTMRKQARLNYNYANATIVKVVQSGVDTPVFKPIIKAVPKPIIKTVPKPIIKAVPKPIIKAVPKPIIKTVPKPIIKTVPKPIIKAVPKPIIKAVPKTIIKSVSKPITTKPVVRHSAPLHIPPTLRPLYKKVDETRHRYVVAMEAKQIQKAKAKKEKYDALLQKETLKTGGIAKLSYKQYIRTDSGTAVRKEGIRKRKKYLHRRAYEHRVNSAKQNIQKLGEHKTLLESRKEMANRLYTKQNKLLENTNAATEQRQHIATMFMNVYATNMQQNTDKSHELVNRINRQVNKSQKS